ncbi:23S rRNA pseudouridine(1911/1915/1917) synthase RluD [Gammaproteobacteria bacterium AS21]|jgi:23S rRNA pseudouridine1911/1915/1917 synthase
MSEKIELEARVPSEYTGKRFDQVVALLFAEFSRSRLTLWIKEGAILVDGKELKPREKLYGGEKIVVNAMVEDMEVHEAEDIPLDIVYEDDDIMVVNKPAGLVVHPAVGNRTGTLLNGLLHYYPAIAQVPRAGIVHRLDMDTTGLMVIAKTLQAQTDLVGQLQDRSMGREYEAITYGVMTGGGCVDEPMGRHGTNRLKMAVVSMGKEAVTHYRLLEKFRAHSHIRLKLETGRTHQIRVHMSHINYPLVGDQTYGGRARLPKGIDQDTVDVLRAFKRQALHAKKLELWHPGTGEQMSWEIPLPDDFVALLKALQEDAEGFEEY